MKIVFQDARERKVIAEEVNGKLKVNNKTFEDEWKTEGIAIPHLLKKEYGGVDVIKLGEKNFTKALVEIYYKFNMNHRLFKLED